MFILFLFGLFLNQGLKQKFPDAFLEPKIQPLLEIDWVTYQQDKIKVLYVVLEMMVIRIPDTE